MSDLWNVRIYAPNRLFTDSFEVDEPLARELLWQGVTKITRECDENALDATFKVQVRKATR